MYTLEFYAPDGASVKEAESEDLQELLNRWENIGSRWFFYPIGVIFTKKGKVKEVSDELRWLKGKYRKAFEAAIDEEYGND